MKVANINYVLARIKACYPFISRETVLSFDLWFVGRHGDRNAVLGIFPVQYFGAGPISSHVVQKIARLVDTLARSFASAIGNGARSEL